MSPLTNPGPGLNPQPFTFGNFQNFGPLIEGQRFRESPAWRLLVTDLESVGITLLDNLASNRHGTKTLNQPFEFGGTVPSDDQRVNQIYDDGLPNVEEGVRLLYGFRRDEVNPRWTCRFGGLILQTTDRGTADSGYTDFTAWDPWKYLYNRPVRLGDVDLSLPGPNGAVFPAGTTVGNIALTLYHRTLLADGTVHLDAGTSYGGTAFWEGTIAATQPIDTAETTIFQQGQSVGEAWSELCDSGLLDIIITPVYDPVNRPGIVGDLSILPRAGAIQYQAVMAWDKPGRSLIGIEKLKDGTARANKIKFYAGQGGPAFAAGILGDTDGALHDDTSQTLYGKYVLQQWFPKSRKKSEVKRWAEEQLLLVANGKMVYSISPSPSQGPFPFSDYDVGDWVPVVNSARLRKAETAALQRIYSIPFVIDDDEREAIEQLVLSDEPPPV